MRTSRWLAPLALVGAVVTGCGGGHGDYSAGARDRAWRALLADRGLGGNRPSVVVSARATRSTDTSDTLTVGLRVSRTARHPVSFATSSYGLETYTYDGARWNLDGDVGASLPVVVKLPPGATAGPFSVEVEHARFHRALFLAWQGRNAGAPWAEAGG